MASGVVKHGWATDDIIVELVTTDIITIPGTNDTSNGHTGHVTAVCDKTGYTPIGIVGIEKYTNISGGGGTSQCMIYEFDVGWNSTSSHYEAKVYLRNFQGGDAKFYCKLYILYEKNN